MLCIRRWLVPLGIMLLVIALVSPRSATAAVQPIYSLPFYVSFIISCGFGCYSGHAGTDFQIGVVGAGGEQIIAAATGTARPCQFNFLAGNSLLMNHVNGTGHRTRYLHLRDPAIPVDGANVARGQVVGYEGNTGDVRPVGSYM